ANVEKTIFLGPDPLQLPDVRPGLEDLRLSSLSPAKSTLRTRLPVSFAGKQHWFLLEDLEEGRRYEVRICWAATQPTSFWLDTHTITTVLETPDLVSALASYSESIAESVLVTERSQTAEASSSLFLQIRAAADFYTTNKTLMNSPPDVKVDVILDPFILNVLPRSLAPTGVYIVVVAVVAWFLSGVIARFISSVGQSKPHND
ncbi:hypothetical protein K490DRAFT_17936, partial [Saccharata proteae CBS 121410]